MVFKPHRRPNHDFRGKDLEKHPTSEDGTTKTSYYVEPTRHAEFWLHDGSIVLCVQDTLFRVHQTILANHSEVFADLFRLPQPTEEGEDAQTKEGDEMQKIEGCHVVHLQDNVDDFVDVLKAIYYPSHFENLSPTADLDTILTFISGILRLSTKYFIRELRKRCIALLTSKFPTTYQEYLARSHKSSSSRSHSKISLTLSTPNSSPAPSSPASIPVAPSTSTSISASTSTSHTLVPSTPATPHPPSTTKEHSKHKTSSIMRAIHLAQQTNVPLILPYAFYEIARNLPRRLLSHSSTSISWHQKTICLVGREQLRLAEMSLTHSFLLAFQPSLRCLTPSFCGNARGPHAEWHVLESTGHGPNPLKAYDKWEKMNVCAECIRDSRRAHERGREEVWERLPQFFELGGWAELRVTQARQDI